MVRFSGIKLEHIVGAVTLLAVLVGSLIFVRIFKNPNQMGVLESQSMDMSKAAPPVGAVPVGLATVALHDVQGAFSYTGTVQAYSDESVVPRITGRITNMPVYPGDRIRKGQVLVQLDGVGPSEYQAKLTQATFAADAARHNAEIAKEDANEKRSQADAAVQAEREAKQALEQVKANLAYWEPEIKREKSLLQQSVVSQQEYENEQSQYLQAKAQVEQAKAKVKEAHSTAVAAAASAAAMVHHINHQWEESRRADAAEQEASIIKSYTTIRASDDGVVIKRLVSPGVVVSPGTEILKVAHIDPVRVQVQVAFEDLGRIKRGDPVEIAVAADAEHKIHATLTAVFSAADPTARTTTAEALVPNPESTLLPGQYVVVNIGTASRKTLSVPTSAIVRSAGKSQVWKAVGPSSEARKIAELVPVEVGLSNLSYTEITRGLEAGDQVIYAGQEGLQPGTAVVAVEWGNEGPSTLPTPAQTASARLDETDKWTLKRKIGDMIATISLQPSPPKGGSNSIVVTLQEPSGATVSGAKVSAKTSMPTMSMGGPDLDFANTSGSYKTDANFMSGLWEIDLSVTAPGHVGQLTITAEVP